MSVQISNKEQRTSRQWGAGGNCLTKCQSRSHIMLLHGQRARTEVCVGTGGGVLRRRHCQQLSLAQLHFQLLTRTSHLNTLKVSQIQ